jgi:hypothetical protein
MLINPGYAAIDPETGVAAWLFEEEAGKIIEDSSGYSNNGDIEGAPGWVAGKFGKALDFDGETDHVIIPDSDSLELAEVTLAAWVFLRSYPEDARIITQEVDGAPYSTYSLMMSGGGYTKLEFRIALDNVRSRIPTNADVPLEKWTHVAATYDGSKAVVYIDGAVDKEQPLSGTLLTTDNPVYLGASQFWDPRFYDGLMDDAVIFNVGLSEDDIVELMEAGLPTILAVFPAGKLAVTWGSIKE